MKKYFITIGQKNDFTAGSKAKDDVAKILEHNGFEEIKVDVYLNKIQKLLFLHSFWNKALKNISEGLIVFQFPMHSHVLTQKFLSTIQKKKNIRTIALVHDIESARLDISDDSRATAEIKELNQFDVLITHNDKMSEFLKGIGVHTMMIPLGIFDYLTKDPMLENPKNYLTFAGNLTKAPFLEQYTEPAKIMAFGPNPASSYPDSVDYQGVFPPDELGIHLDGKFGLIWDGDSPADGSGTYGEYTKINNPHKASLYLSLGVPVIVWKEAAIADFIKAHHAGISVSSLVGIQEQLSKISDEDYNVLKWGARAVGEELRKGHYLMEAIEKSQQSLVKR